MKLLANINTVKEPWEEVAMVGINLEDVLGVLDTVKGYLIALAVIIGIAIVVITAAHWLKGPAKTIVRGNAAVVSLASLIVIANLIVLGPMSTLINLTTGAGQVQAKTTEQAKQVAEQIAEEGFVLLKNESNTLPLQNVTNINLFGWASSNPTYAGGGSGGINQLYPTVTLQKGLENSGFRVNAKLMEFYKKYSERPEMSINKQSWSLPEPPANTYPQELIDSAKDFSDTAMVVIARGASEGANDLPTDVSKAKFESNSKDYEDFKLGEHYLQLSQTERDMLNLVSQNFAHIIVLYNGANPMELGFINEIPHVEAAIWAAGPGHVGFNALGKILRGTVNPSGRTTDTLVYDMTAAPWWNNAVKTNYSNMKDLTVQGMNAGKPQKFSPAFINYAEGIYVGYKYYETAAAEGVIDYAKTVQFPFGYGLSYTTFEQSMSDIISKGDNLTFDVTVTNTGDAAGKDVVQVYANPPYTNGGVEKASANLLTEQKSKLLQPGESQNIPITVRKDALASYDNLNKKSWVLEAGNYEISINQDSHTVLDHRTYTVTADVVYDGSTTHNRDQVAATNQFNDVKGDVTYLSRTDHFANIAQATAKGNDVMPASEQKQYHINKNFDFTTYQDDSVTMPTTGKENNITLAQLRGVDITDKKWDELLDEMSVQDMVDLTSLAGYQTAAVKSIGKVQVNDADGPAAINNNFTGAGSIGFPVATVIAQTWNPDLVREYGNIMGKMAKEMDVTGWYAPGVNIHRTPFGGRNYEYYSEDGVLTGIMAASAIQGVQKQGLYAFIKHFALYDGNSKMVSVWSNEQAIREIYLKPFEIGIKDGNARALMVSWNYIGTKWAGESSALLKTVLRQEWGFKGMTVSDYFRDNGHGFMNADAALANGVDAMLSTYGAGPNVPADTSVPSTVADMRTASRHILYTVVNSWKYENGEPKAPLAMWKIGVFVVDGVLAVALIGVEIFILRKAEIVRKRDK